MTRDRLGPPDEDPPRDARTGRSAAAERMAHQTQWVELQLQQAMARGDFDNLPGFGKPIEGLGTEHDPDWWLKRLVEREKITGVLPPSLQLRKDDAGLALVLDMLPSAADVRREVEDFNERVLKARYQPLGGPPLITQPRDVEAEVAAWTARRQARFATWERNAAAAARPRRWFRRS